VTITAFYCENGFGKGNRMKMKIGIEAKWYFEGPPSGRRVIKSLVDNILAIDKINHYFIFLNAKHKDRPFPFKDQSNVTVIYIWAGNNAVSNIFVIPFYSRKHGLDVTLYQTFISPFDRGRTIAYIHDVLFLSNPEFYTVFERLYFTPLRFLAQRATSIITVSAEEKKRLLQFNYSEEADKIKVVYHGVDRSFATKDRYDPELVKHVQRTYQLPDRFVLFVGRLNLRKNVENLLRGIALISDKEIPVVIVGADDWKKSNHLSVIRDLGLERRILFTGPIYESLGVVYSLSSVFCFPSHAESFGLPALEAMASGVPVVVSSTTSLPEICGDAGIYVDPDSPASIAAGIDNLLTNPELYYQKRQAGLARSGIFTWEEAARRTIACLTSV
jgi:glycosyltransferase involved in cell wall biosynthesis